MKINLLYEAMLFIQVRMRINTTRDFWSFDKNDCYFFDIEFRGIENRFLFDEIQIIWCEDQELVALNLQCHTFNGNSSSDCKMILLQVYP